MTKAQMAKQLEEAQAKTDEGRALLEEVRDELQEKFDKLSAKKQESDEGEALEELINEMGTHHDNLEEFGQASFNLP